MRWVSTHLVHFRLCHSSAPWPGLCLQLCIPGAVPSLPLSDISLVRLIAGVRGKGEVPSGSDLCFPDSCQDLGSCGMQDQPGAHPALIPNVCLKALGRNESTLPWQSSQSLGVTACQAPGSQSILLSSSFLFCRITWKCIWDSSSSWSLQEQVITTL